MVTFTLCRTLSRQRHLLTSREGNDRIRFSVLTSSFHFFDFTGCGKSLLLSALGDRLTPDVRVSGEIKMNGRRQRLGHGACGFVPKVLTAALSLHWQGLGTVTMQGFRTVKACGCLKWNG
jgi:hypothetical protein